MKSFFLSCAYLSALIAAIDRIQVERRPNWLRGVSYLNLDWFYAWGSLFLCFTLLSALNELYSGERASGTLRHALRHLGIGAIAYAIFRTGMASFNPWCTGGMLCAPREAQTVPLWIAFAVGATLALASGLFPAPTYAQAGPSLLGRRPRIPSAYVEK